MPIYVRVGAPVYLNFDSSINMLSLRYVYLKNTEIDTSKILMKSNVIIAKVMSLSNIFTAVLITSIQCNEMPLVLIK